MTKKKTTTTKLYISGIIQIYVTLDLYINWEKEQEPYYSFEKARTVYRKEEKQTDDRNINKIKGIYYNKSWAFFILFFFQNVQRLLLDFQVAFRISSVASFIRKIHANILMF